MEKAHTPSYEVAMPSLSIQEGSTISIDGNTTTVGGNIWLDRQTVTGKSDPNHPKPLYIGNWLAVNMNDGTVYGFSFFWSRQLVQWIVGSELDPPVPPVGKIGIEYPALKTWNGSSPVQGAHVLEATEFDLNILKPKDPSLEIQDFWQYLLHSMATENQGQSLHNVCLVI